MRARKESDLQAYCDSQPEKQRLSSYRKRLLADKLDVVFDERSVDLLIKYAWKPSNVRAELDYLDGLRDPDGIRFSRSNRQYSKMEKTWESFRGEEAPNFTWNRHFKRAFGRVVARYAKAKLKPLVYKSNEDIQEAVSDWTTSSGFTAIKTGVLHKGDFDETKLYGTWQNKVKSALREGSFNSYMVAGVRTQASGEYTDSGERTHTCKHKTRPIWMVDMWTVISERIFAKPFTEWCSEFDDYTALGKSDENIQRWVFRNRIKFNFWKVFDFRNFDASEASWLIHVAFLVLRAAFTLNKFESDLLDVIEEDFINKNLITADGVVHVSHGDPSGSGLTTIINNIVNMLVIETWVSKFQVRKVSYRVLGDDALIFLNENLHLSEVASYIQYNFWIEVNVEKSQEGDQREDPEFLSRYWTDYGPWRHPHILISKIAFPEKFRRYGKGYSTPAMTIYSYILGYRKAMEELMDVESFLIDYGLDTNKIQVSDREFKNLPYNVQTKLFEMERRLISKSGIPDNTRAA